MIPRGTVVTSKSDLHRVLQSWYRETEDPTLGDVGTFGRKRWLWLDFRDLPRRACINADTTREAVRVYLDDVARRGSEVSWRVTANRLGSMNKVVFNDDGREIAGWYCYLV